MRRSTPAALGLLLCLCLLGLGLGPAGCASGDRGTSFRDVTTTAQRPLPPVLADFRSRLAASRAQVPAIVAMAEDAAGRTLANPEMLINVPYGEQPSFAEELLNRAGGLSNALPPEERPRLLTPQDVALIAVRAWGEEDVRKFHAAVAKCGESQIVLFASRAGMPEGIRFDHLIDNGAPSGEAAHAPLNAIVNALHGWLWTVEYAAALTRRGKYPGTLLSIVMPDSEAHNRALQRSGAARRFLGDAAEPIPAGRLAGAYLQRVERLVGDLNTPRTRAQIDAAAEKIAEHLAAGGTVGVATNTHILMSEIFEDRKLPTKPFLVHGRSRRAFPDHVGPGDLLFYIAYVGLSTEYEDYSIGVRESGATLISSYVSDERPETAARNDAASAVHIEQHWAPPDAALAVPFPPGVIAPISGMDQALIYRLTEDAAARKLAALEAAAQTTAR